MRFAGQSRWRSADFLADPLSLSAPDFYARQLGFDVTADALTGKALADGRWSEVERHVRVDVFRTALLAARLEWFTTTRLNDLRGTEDPRHSERQPRTV
jgi:hypothetical protein